MRSSEQPPLNMEFNPRPRAQLKLLTDIGRWSVGYWLHFLASFEELEHWQSKRPVQQQPMAIHVNITLDFIGDGYTDVTFERLNKMNYAVNSLPSLPPPLPPPRYDDLSIACYHFQHVSHEPRRELRNSILRRRRLARRIDANNVDYSMKIMMITRDSWLCAEPLLPIKPQSIKVFSFPPFQLKKKII